MKARSASEPDIAARLRLALDACALTVVYQPKIKIASGDLAGVEALARWDDPELGTVPASVFVPIAERFGLIDALTHCILRTCLKQWIAWREQGLEVRLAFNVSALSLGDVDLPDTIERLCMIEGVPCDVLTVEVTESATQSVVSLLDTLTRFRIKGFGVSLDDFGTGYSSLMQLRQLPYSEMKIDRCFVADLDSSAESRLIVKAIVDLAHGLGLTATAEGVEEAGTLNFLREIGCDEAQGFLISEGIEGRHLADWLLHSTHRVRPLGTDAASPWHTLKLG